MYQGISKSLEWAWNLIKWVIAILLIIITILLYKIYNDNSNPCECKDQETIIESTRLTK